MLVMSRKLGQKIFIGDDVCVTVVDIDYGKVRLGVEAPRDIIVDREEVRIRRKGWTTEVDPEVEAELKELQGNKPATF